MGKVFANGDWRIVIHKAEEGGYWGEIPALDGCASEGETIEETRANVIEAAQGCLLAQLKWALARASAAENPILDSKCSELAHA